ncbi:MAG: hypothetical protein R2713_01675 [Ilumatobacteraceae bacterium]
MLHDWRIEPREYERQEARRGRRHAFEMLEPHRTALVVVDMVPFFADIPYVRGIMPNIQRLASTVRATGGVVAWVLPSADEPSPARIEFLGPTVAETYRASGGPGELRATGSCPSSRSARTTCSSRSPQRAHSSPAGANCPRISNSARSTP